MARRVRCKLCGEFIQYNDLLGSDHWRNNYCSDICRSVDETLPAVEDARIYDVPAWVARARYNLIIQSETCRAYKEPFTEEEDDIMREYHGFEE